MHILSHVFLVVLLRLCRHYHVLEYSSIHHLLQILRMMLTTIKIQLQMLYLKLVPMVMDVSD